MSTQRDNDKLDKLISSTINTEKPHFNAQMWKQKYPNEYKALVSRKEKAASSRQPSILRAIFSKPLIQLTAVAAVIVAVGLLLSQGRQKPDDTASNPELITESPTKIISMASMRMTYQQGGFDALDKQFRDTLDVLGPRSPSVSIQELLKNSTMF